MNLSQRKIVFHDDKYVQCLKCSVNKFHILKVKGEKGTEKGISFACADYGCMGTSKRVGVGIASKK